MPKAGEINDLTGKLFGRLTVMRLVRIHPQQGALWLCKCECGKERVVARGLLIDKKVTECHTCAKATRQKARRRWCRPFGGITER